MSEPTLTRVEFGPAEISLAERDGVILPEIDIAESLKKELGESGVEIARELADIYPVIEFDDLGEQML